MHNCLMPSFSIVVPTRNEAHNILPFLESIPAEVSLIVVDSSEDNTRDLINQHRLQNTIVINRTVNITTARQIGAAAAETDYLIFTDADVTFAPDYFDHLPEYLESGLIYGAKLSQDNFSTYYRWFMRGQALSHALGIPAASGSNLIIRRDVLQQVGGFDPELTVNEDTEIAFRVKRAGFPVSFAPGLKVYEQDHRRLERGVLRKTIHSVGRSLMLFFNIMPPRWKTRDWGYWKKSAGRGEHIR